MLHAVRQLRLGILKRLRRSRNAEQLRQLELTASEVLVETRRVEARGSEAKRTCRSLAIFSGSAGGSREAIYQKAIEEKVEAADAHAEYAKLFASQSQKLSFVPLEEIDRVQTKLSNALTEVRALREDLEREYASVEGQCAAYREQAVHGAPK